MKKFVTLGIMIAGMTFAANAQNFQYRVGKNNTTLTKANKAYNRGTAIDTVGLTPASWDANSPCDVDIYGTANGGLVAGTNTPADKEFAMGYTLSSFGQGMPAQLLYVAVPIGYINNIGNGTVTSKVYADNGNSAPGTLLGTSNSYTLSQLNDTAYSYFDFAAPIALTTDRFYVSVDISGLYATHDTLALLTTDGTCASSTITTAYIRSSAGTFGTFESRYTSPDDIMIFPIVTAQTTGVRNVVRNDFGASAFPNPATNNVTIAFKGQDNGKTSLQLTDITGKAIATSSVQTVKGTSYKVPFDLSGLSGGLYFVQIASGNNKGMIKVSVQ